MLSNRRLKEDMHLNFKAGKNYMVNEMVFIFSGHKLLRILQLITIKKVISIFFNYSFKELEIHRDEEYSMSLSTAIENYNCYQ